MNVYIYYSPTCACNAAHTKVNLFESLVGEEAGSSVGYDSKDGGQVALEQGKEALKVVDLEEHFTQAFVPATKQKGP